MTPTKQSTRAVGVALLCLVLALTPVGASEAQSAALIRLAPGAATVGAGLTTAVTVRIENVADLYGCDIRLSFDPAAVEVVDADSLSEGVQIRPGELLSPDFVVRNQADNAAGTVWFAMTQLNPSEAVTGSGVVLTVLFRGKAAGASSPLTVIYHKLASRSGDLIPASTEDGEIRVVSDEQAPPTPTVAPTRPPATAVPTALPPTVAPTAVPTVAPVTRQPTVAASATSVPPTAAASATSAPPTAAPTAVQAATPAATAAPSATAAAPTAASPTATSAAPLSTPTANPASGVGARTSLWLIVYALLFAAALAVTVIGVKARRNK